MKCDVHASGRRALSPPLAGCPVLLAFCRVAVQNVSVAAEAELLLPVCSPSWSPTQVQLLHFHALLMGIGWGSVPEVRG